MNHKGADHGGKQNTPQQGAVQIGYDFLQNKSNRGQGSIERGRQAGSGPGSGGHTTSLFGLAQ